MQLQTNRRAVKVCSIVKMDKMEWLEALKPDSWSEPQMTKTDAMQTFKLPAGQLEGLTCELKRNPHTRYFPMKLYLRQQVFERAEQYHRSKQQQHAAR